MSFTSNIYKSVKLQGYEDLAYYITIEVFVSPNANSERLRKYKRYGVMALAKKEGRTVRLFSLSETPLAGNDVIYFVEYSGDMEHLASYLATHCETETGLVGKENNNLLFCQVRMGGIRNRFPFWRLKQHFIKDTFYINLMRSDVILVNVNNAQIGECVEGEFFVERSFEKLPNLVFQAHREAWAKKDTFNGIFFPHMHKLYVHKDWCSWGAPQVRYIVSNFYAEAIEESGDSHPLIYSYVVPEFVELKRECRKAINWQTNFCINLHSSPSLKETLLSNV